MIPYKKIICIFLLSIIIQTFFVFIYKNTIDPMLGDGEAYHRLASNLLEKHAFVGFISNDDVNVRRPPGYPFFMALIYKIFGRSILALQVVQMILIGFACVLIYLLGAKILDDKVVFKIGILSAVNPVLVPLAFYVTSEGLTVFLVTLIFYINIKLVKRLDILWCIFLGILLGVTTLIKPIVVFLPFVIISMVSILNRGTKILKFMLAILLPFLIIVSAWTMRNYVLTKYFIPVSIGGDIELWNGSYLPGHGYSDHPQTHKRRRELYVEFKERIGGVDKFNEGFNHVLVVQMFRGEAIKNIINDPVAYISLIPRKVFRLYIGSFCYLYGLDESFSDMLSMNFLNKKDYLLPLFLKAAILLNSVAIFLLCILGAISNYKNKLALPAIMIFAYWTGINIIFSPISRFSIPILPIMIFLAVLGVVRIDSFFTNYCTRINLNE